MSQIKCPCCQKLNTEYRSDINSHDCLDCGCIWTEALRRATAEGGWRDISSAPRDGTEVLLWRDDAGVMLGSWTSLDQLLPENQWGGYTTEDLETESWWYADLISGSRLEGTEMPTLWQPLPAPPEAGEEETE